MLFKRKIFKNAMLAIFALLFCAISFFGFPIDTSKASAEVLDDYEEFYDSFMQMVQEYDVPKEDDKISVAMVMEEDNTPNYQTRLIVTTDEKVDGFGAIASCHYKNHYYFQYEDYYDTDKAYDYFSGLENVSVMYDYKTTLNGDTIQINATNYNSWGWNAQNDYLGANSYLTTLMETVGSGNLINQVVAVLDTGINTSHVLFKDRILTEFARNFTPNSYGVTNPSDYEDGNGHGTHVSGIIAEITPSSVKILPLRVLDSTGNGYVTYITAALDHALSKKAQIEAKGYQFKIMNMSLGITEKSSISNSASVDSVSAYASKPSYVDLSSWVLEAYNSGIVAVVSAGNTKNGGVKISASPANVANAITITALKRTYISRTPMMYDYDYSDYGPTVDFAAPGTNITSAWIGSSTATATISGTSMAAPHATACVALIYSNPQYQNYSFQKLNTLLQENANRSMIYSNKYALTSSTVKNDYYGYGIINIKNIGTVIDGSVQFSHENRFSDSSITLGLSSNITCDAGQTVEIYYTDDENAESVSSTTGKLYTKPFTIDKTTRIVATAFVKQGTVVVRRSEIAISVYYIKNRDLESRYKMSNGVITQYTGTELTTLDVPEKISGENVTGINSKAFADSPVQILNLPKTFKKIYENAFSSNTRLREIHCVGPVSVGDYAFQRCTNLSVVDMSIVSVGVQAFAYSSIQDIELLNVKTIGKNAFSASSLKSILIGKNIESIGSHTQMKLQKVYGFAGTASEDFADAQDAQFIDLTLRVIDDLPSQKVVKEGDSITLQVSCGGYKVYGYVEGVGNSYSARVDEGWEKSVVKFVIPSQRTGNYNTKIVVYDYSGDKIEFNVMKLIVVPRNTETYRLNYNSAEYDLYVDGVMVDSDVELFKGQNYTIQYVAHSGYDINSVVLNDEHISIDGFYIENVTDDMSLSVNTIEKNSLTVNFVSKYGDIYVGNDKLTVEYYSVERNSSLSFKVVSNLGWLVKRVLVDGVEISPNSNNVYTISNITSKKTVEVKYEEANYFIEITFVNSCGSYIVSNGGNLSNVAHGSSREITISAYEGYAVDFVSIDGQLIKVSNGTFRIENIDSDKEIVVSFKKQKTSLFKRDHSTILYYFIIILAFFAIFLIGSVIVHFVKKDKKQE